MGGEESGRALGGVEMRLEKLFSRNGNASS